MPTIDRVEEKERLAINLFDLDRVSPDIRPVLLGGRLQLTPIRMDKDRPDETGVEFTCPLLEAALIIDTLRGHDKKVGDYPTRAYIRRGTAWTKLPGDRILTIISEEGDIRLNSLFFDVPPAPAIPKKKKRIEH